MKIDCLLFEDYFLFARKNQYFPLLVSNFELLHDIVDILIILMIFYSEMSLKYLIPLTTAKNKHIGKKDIDDKQIRIFEIIDTRLKIISPKILSIH